MFRSLLANSGQASLRFERCRGGKQLHRGTRELVSSVFPESSGSFSQWSARSAQYDIYTESQAFPDCETESSNSQTRCTSGARWLRNLSTCEHLSARPFSFEIIRGQSGLKQTSLWPHSRTTPATCVLSWKAPLHQPRRRAPCSSACRKRMLSLLRHERIATKTAQQNARLQCAARHQQ